jgi:RHH-type proline utilization regulon transcriptional repressor/proline dehydrogenase/delta 1-pyrroline-5-carboxylate dehydrogenase
MMLENRKLAIPEGLRAQINEAYRAPELQTVQTLLKAAQLDPKMNNAIQDAAISLVTAVRAGRKKNLGIDSFLTEYSLSSEEGIALMCLAEALLRVPDDSTINSLIKDKIASVDWKSHQGQSDSFFINATTWALMLTGSVLAPEKATTRLNQAIMTVLNRSGEGVVRMAVEKGMRIMSKQFVMGRTIKEALKRAKKKEAQGYRYSYDMLGEAALTEADAERYFKAYAAAIDAIGTEAKDMGVMYAKPGISIKLSALHPRYQEAHRDRVLSELGPKLLTLAQMAKQHAITLTIDAEESERLELSMDVIERVFEDPSLMGWDGFGLAVQSYQKRAFYLLDWLADMARRNHRRIMVRLIKGAYWDSEIKKTQMQGLNEYPVFTRKVFTDLSFQACAKKILTMTDVIYPQFATHNAYSVALIMSLVGDYRDFEFQCLHGMGTELYEQIVPENCYNIPCRIYAPVGSHEDLLPYLVRRLLENGANSSFVNRIVDESAPIADLVEDPVQKSSDLLNKINHNIPLPANIFSPERLNSIGIDLSSRSIRAELQTELANLEPFNWQVGSIVGNQSLQTGKSLPIDSPQTNQIIGQYIAANGEDIEHALNEAEQAFGAWGKTSVAERSACLLRFADLLEENMALCMAILCLEAGKTWSDAIGEVREAVDFCRYYAAQATKLLAEPLHLKGYTGESNVLTLHPRGTILCISPWNFPLAIFTGQIVAALVTGNCVIAKPAEQTPVIAFHAVQWMRKAGFPAGVIQLLTGSGSTIGAALVSDKRIKGVIFTGSTQTANRIHKSLAAREEIIPLIAETGGQNAMIVDSSALLEQVTLDVMNSAFGSAGQRCSALRVLFVQEEVYPRMKDLLKGAMSELCIGDPRWLSTDVGPVIDEDALTSLQAHVTHLSQNHEVIYQCTLPKECSSGNFMAPTALAIEHLQVLEKEVFGPVLHVIHSRLNSTVDYIRERVHVGNCYVNRNMIGAVVGLQPFGGEGLSGTGPKAGGPFYLQRMCVERTVTVDTTAAGGNASLMSIPD